MSDWLAIGLGGATFLVSAVVVIVLVSWMAMRLRPPEGWGRLPSPPRALDVSMLAVLPLCGSLTAGALGAGLIVDALGAEADYVGAVVKWAKALAPISVYACVERVRETLTKDRPRYAAMLNGEVWEPPPERSSSRRMRGVLLLAAVLAGAVWMTGLPQPMEPQFINIP